MILREWLAAYAPKLAARGFDAPVRVLRQLAAHRTGVSEAKLLAEAGYAFDEKVAAQLRYDGDALAEGYPLGYLYGEVPFLDLDLKVDARGLIPRPETEYLTQSVIDEVTQRNMNPKHILDLCCGTGAIGLALAQAFPAAQVWLTDLDEAALTLAQENAEKHGLTARCHFAQGDLWQALDAHLQFEVIVSNPPYIDRSETLPDSVTGHEPNLALFSDDEGMAHIKTILTQLPQRMAKGGLAAFELSHRHQALLSPYLEAQMAESKYEWRKDPWQIPRFLWVLT